MGKCALVKFNGNCQDDSLLHIGELRVKNDGNNDIKGILGTSIGNVTCESLKGDCYVAGSYAAKPEQPFTQPYALTSANSFWISPGAELSIQNYYNLTRNDGAFALPIRNVNCFSGSSIVLSIDGGSLADFKAEKFSEHLVNIYIISANLTLDILNRKIAELPLLSLFSIKEKINCELKDLVVIPQLNNLSIEEECNVSGSIEDFVAKYRQAGYNSKSMTVTLYGSITFNGSKISGWNKQLSWTASTITYNGTTIDA